MKLLVLAMTMMTIHARQLDVVNLGSGNRGLVFSHINPLDPRQPHYTVALACNLNPGFFMVATYVDGDPDTQTIVKEVLNPEYAESFFPHFWSGWTTKGIFSFDVDAAFDGGNIYRIEKGHSGLWAGSS